MMPEPVRNWVARSVVPHLPRQAAKYARRSFLAMPRTPEAMFFDNFAAIGLRGRRIEVAVDVKVLADRLQHERRHPDGAFAVIAGGDFPCSPA